VIGVDGFGFIDVGWKIDTTGIGVLLWESDERRVIADTLVLEPPVDESRSWRRSSTVTSASRGCAAG
jgi:hypothetical protein